MVFITCILVGKTLVEVLVSVEKSWRVWVLGSEIVLFLIRIPVFLGKAKQVRTFLTEFLNASFLCTFKRLPISLLDDEHELSSSSSLPLSLSL